MRRAPVPALVALALVTACAPAGPDPAYQQILDDGGTRIGAALDGLATASTYSELGPRLSRAGSTVGEVVRTLRSTPAPEDLVEAHRDLVVTLDGLASTLADLESRVAEQRVCTAGAVVTDLAVAADAPRTAAAGLVGYGFPLRVPVPVDAGPGPSNGEQLLAAEGDGLGRVQMRNGTPDDVVVVLGDGSESRLEFAVTAGLEAAVEPVPDGRYDVYVIGGAEYDRAARAFGRDCTFQRFDGATELVTTDTASVVLDLGLDVADGNAVTRPVRPEDLPR